MKKILMLFLVLITIFSLTACDDFTRNVDGVIYDTYCYNKSGFNYYTLVKILEEEQVSDLVNEEVIIGEFENKEYYFISITIYDYFLVEINGSKGEYYPILEAIEKDDYVIEFLVDWCVNNWESDELLSRDK